MIPGSGSTRYTAWKGWNTSGNGFWSWTLSPSTSTIWSQTVDISAVLNWLRTNRGLDDHFIHECKVTTEALATCKAKWGLRAYIPDL